MTREDAYAEGFSDGWRWAEADLRDGAGAWWELDLRAQLDAATGERARAETLGNLRGYRGAFAAFERGALAREAFDAAPIR